MLIILDSLKGFGFNRTFMELKFTIELNTLKSSQF